MTVGLAGGVALGLAVGSSGGLILGLMYGLPVGLMYGLAVGHGLLGGLAGGVIGSLVLGLVFGLVLGLLDSLTILRPDEYIFSFLGRIPRISPLISTRIEHQIVNLLESDWEIGLMNANQFLNYSHQFIAVDQAINKVLSSTQLIDLLGRIAKLSDLICDWEILRYSSASLPSDLTDRFLETISMGLPEKSSFVERWIKNIDLRFDTAVHTAAASF